MRQVYLCHGAIVNDVVVTLRCIREKDCRGVRKIFPTIGMALAMEEQATAVATQPLAVDTEDLVAQARTMQVRRHPSLFYNLKLETG